VTFSPERSGRETATLRIISNDLFQKGLSVELTGSGIALPAIWVSSDLLSFEEVNRGNVSVARLLSVKNTGASGLNVFEVRLGGKDGKDFSLVSNSCSGAVLPPGAGCVVSVQFNPAGEGVKRAQLEIESNDLIKQVYPVRLTGNSALFPHLNARPDPCEFGEVPVGSSLVKTVRFMNSGGVELRVGKIVLDDQAKGEFDLVRNNCSGQSILPAMSGQGVQAYCEVDLIFLPSSVGEKTGGLHVAMDDPSLPIQTIFIAGMGVNPVEKDYPGPLAWIAILALILRMVLGLPVSAKGWAKWIKKSN
jgi:hypothetical protein